VVTLISASSTCSRLAPSLQVSVYQVSHGPPACIAGMRRSSRLLPALIPGPTRRSPSSIHAIHKPLAFQQCRLVSSTRGEEAIGDVTPPLPDSCPRLPFRFETGFALSAKRPPRPFPPPFLSPPSGSFSDPLSTHHQSRDKRVFVHGELIRGWTNGDDAIYASDHFICANDGVGAWSARPRGHAGYRPSAPDALHPV
jgi:protein phosphatase PTC7